MNLAPVNSNGMIHVSSHPTPASQDPPSDPPSLTFEQYHSPLVNAYCGPNYATLRSNAGQWTNFVSVPDTTMGMITSHFCTVNSYQLNQNIVHYLWSSKRILARIRKMFG